MIRHWFARLVHWAAVTALTLVVLAVPTTSYLYVKHRVQLGQQVSPPVLAPLSAALKRQFAEPTAPGLVVLGYHDLLEQLPERAGDAGRRVSVTDTAFATHLRMLRVAGYESVSATQVADFLAGRATLPERAVLISFDGARWRDWSHADPVLRAYGYRAVIFIDPATVRVQRGVTLSWLALRTMVGTGRWSVGVAGTRETVARAADGSRASALLTHRWLDAEGRPETSAEFAGRLNAMFDRQRRAIVAEGLPDPKLFSYPFQPRYPLNSAGAVLDELNAAVAANFAGGVLTMAPDETVDAGWVARRVLPRIEVYSTTTDEILFNRVRDAAASPSSR